MDIVSLWPDTVFWQTDRSILVYLFIICPLCWAMTEALRQTGTEESMLSLTKMQQHASGSDRNPQMQFKAFKIFFSFFFEQLQIVIHSTYRSLSAYL